MDFDASGFVDTEEATTFFLARSEAAAQRGEEAGANCVKVGMSTKIASDWGAGGAW